jgi:hypothetical protein
MSVSKDDLNAFHQFAEAALSRGSAESLHELVDIWETENLSPELHAQNVAAVSAAVKDMQNGDTGRPADTVINELRAELNSRSTQ